MAPFPAFVAPAFGRVGTGYTGVAFEARWPSGRCKGRAWEEQRSRWERFSDAEVAGVTRGDPIPWFVLGEGDLVPSSPSGGEWRGSLPPCTTGGGRFLTGQPVANVSLPFLDHSVAYILKWPRGSDTLFPGSRGIFPPFPCPSGEGLVGLPPCPRVSQSVPTQKETPIGFYHEQTRVIKAVALLPIGCESMA